VLVRNRRAELGLDHELVKLAEQYLADRDLQRLMASASEVVRRSREDLEHARWQQDDRAEIFRQKVRRVLLRGRGLQLSNLMGLSSAK
jgi:hypothetical protein